MTVAAGTMRRARQLRDLARSTRSQAHGSPAGTRMLVAAAAAAEDQFAAAIDRLAAQRPSRAAQLRGISDSARGRAARRRRRLAGHPGGGTRGSCRDDAPAATQLAPGPGGTPAAAATATTPGHACDLPVTGERDRIAAQLQDTIIRRVFAAGLRLESAAGLTTDPQVRCRIEAAAGELDQVIREIRNAVFQDVPHRRGRSLSQDILDLGGELATTASVSFSGLAGRAVPADDHARLLLTLRQLLGLIGEHATPTSIAIAADTSTCSLTIEAAALPPGAPPGAPASWFSAVRARAAQAGAGIAARPAPGGGTRFTCQLPMTGYARDDLR
jgi:signal transduction histidine kinase